MKAGERGSRGKQRKNKRERGVSPYLASVEYKLNEMYHDASTDVPHAELLTKLTTHGEGHSWLNEFLDEEEGEGRKGGMGEMGEMGEEGKGEREKWGKGGRGKGKPLCFGYLQ